MFLFLDRRAISKGSGGEWVTFPSLSLKVRMFVVHQDPGCCCYY